MTAVPGLTAIPTNYGAVANADLWLYLLDGGDEAVLVDAGIHSTPDAGAADLVESALAGTRLSRVLVTHAHQDHAGGAGRWRERFGCRIAVPRGDVLWAEQPQAQWVWFWSTVTDLVDLDEVREQILSWSGPPLHVDDVLRDGDVVDLGQDRVTVVQTGAHTPGHSCFLTDRQRVLLTGDIVQGFGNPSVDGSTAFAPLYHDVAAYRAGLSRLATLPFHWLAAAHRPLMDGHEGRSFVRESLDFVDDVEGLVADLADGGFDDRMLALRIAERCGVVEGCTVQTVTTARAHIAAGRADGTLVRRSTHLIGTP